MDDELSDYQRMLFGESTEKAESPVVPLSFQNEATPLESRVEVTDKATPVQQSSDATPPEQAPGAELGTIPGLRKAADPPSLAAPLYGSKEVASVLPSVSGTNLAPPRRVTPLPLPSFDDRTKDDQLTALVRQQRVSAMAPFDTFHGTLRSELGGPL